MSREPHSHVIVKINAARSEKFSSKLRCLEQDMCDDVSALILSYLTTPFPADHWYLRPKLSLVSQAKFLSYLETVTI